MSVTKTILVEDFYEAKTTEAIVDLWDIDFSVTVPPVNKKWFIILEANSSSFRERMFYHDVIWDKIYVKWVNRIDPKTHLEDVSVKINDSSLLFNFLSENLATTWYIEKIWALSVIVYWWPILKENSEVEVLDTTLTLDDNTTNYICYNYNTNQITSENSEENVVMAVITTASWVITSIKYKNYKFSINWIKSPYDVAVDNWFIWTEEEWLETLVWPPWAIAVAPAWEPQTIIDNSLTIDWATVTTDGTTYIRVTLGNWDYTNYTLTNIVTADDEDNIYSNETITWIFWATWITYSNWNFVNKITWVTSFTWEVMYKNQNNEVTWVNTFNNVTIFKWQAVFKYHVNATWVDLFDADLWSKQWFNFNSWSVTLDFDNLLDWGTYLFSITVNVSTVSLWIWTAHRKWWTLYNTYSIWWETYPLNLEVWTHLFVCESFSSGTHFSYVWKSTLIS